MDDLTDTRTSVAPKPKSILKKPADTNRERKYKAAVQQAELIQQQKETENQIFDATVTFLDFPTNPSSSPSQPSPKDIQTFQRLITPFQPSDYDTLLDERRIADLCGYVFCSNPPKKQATNAKFRVLGHGTPGAKGFRVVEKEKLEQFCSDDCARRALYVRVQLSEEPAWIRRGGSADAISILTGEGGEATSSAVTAADEEQMIDAMKAVAIEKGAGEVTDHEDLRKAMQDLAVERGDVDSSSHISTKLVRDTIVEKATASTVVGR